MEEKVGKSSIKQEFHPKVSIIIPVYNGSNYMREAINSALSQTYDNTEVIVINDGSTDETEEIAKSYENKIRYFSKQNGGVATALNLGIENAEGEYISWLSHDDVYYPNKINVQVSNLSCHPKEKRFNTILYSNYSLIDESSKELHIQQFQEYHDLHKLNYPLYPILKGLVHGCALLIPKICYEEIGYFDVNLKTTQDYDLWFKMFPKYNVEFLSDVLIKSRWHPDQGSKKILSANSEGDDLWIKMMQGVSIAQKVFIDGGVVDFYRKTEKILNEAGYTNALKYAKQEISNFITRDTSAIKVSVIIPFHNRIAWTIEAVQSVLLQTHHNLEIILVNDSSTESIGDLEKMPIFDERVKFFNNQRKKGASGSRNTGIDVAQGEYLSFLDSDDLFAPEKIEKQLKYMVSNGIEFSHTSYILFSENKLEKKICSGNENYSFPEIIAGCAIATPTVMVHTDLIKAKNLRFPENYSLGEDICMWIECANISMCKGLNVCLTRVRKHGGNAAYDSRMQVIGIKNTMDYAITNFLNEKTFIYIKRINASLIFALDKACEIKHTPNESVTKNQESKPVAYVAQASDVVEFKKVKHFSSSLKNNLRIYLRNVIWYVSPTFRMLVGNRERVRMLLEKNDNLFNRIANLENLTVQHNGQLVEKIHLLEQKNENLLKEIANFENLLVQRNNATLEITVRKMLAAKPYGCNENVLGKRIYIAQDHVSEMKKYECNGDAFFEEMKRYILKTDVVLDIGPGIRPQNFFVPRVHICVEPFEQYRKVIKPFLPKDTHFVFLRGDALSVIQNLDDQSVDTVFMIDLIEHLEKKDGLVLLKEADRVARKQIIVFTPLGFYPMHFREEGQKDAWGLDGNDVQEHKSGWLPEDFGQSWDFHICADCHEAFLPEEKAQGKRYSALMAIKTKNFNGFPIVDRVPDFVKAEYEKRYIGEE